MYLTDVNDFVSCDGVFNWYDKAGAVEADKIAKLLSRDQKKVGGL